MIEELAEFDQYNGNRRDKVPFHLEVLISFNFFGQGSFQTGIGRDMHLGVSQPVVSRIINKISRIFTVNLLPRYVKFPTPEEHVR